MMPVSLPMAAKLWLASHEFLLLVSMMALKMKVSKISPCSEDSQNRKVRETKRGGANKGCGRSPGVGG